MTATSWVVLHSDPRPPHMGTPVTSEFPPQQVMGWNFGSHDGHGMIFFTVILIYEYSWWGVWGSLLERELLFFVFPLVQSEAGLNGVRVCRLPDPGDHRGTRFEWCCHVVGLLLELGHLVQTVIEKLCGSVTGYRVAVRPLVVARNKGRGKRLKGAQEIAMTVKKHGERTSAREKRRNGEVRCCLPLALLLASNGGEVAAKELRLLERRCLVPPSPSTTQTGGAVEKFPRASQTYIVVRFTAGRGGHHRCSSAHGNVNERERPRPPATAAIGELLRREGRG
nr:hypothetical protein Iba_chr13cCG14260 [Ipomoea batatas]